MAATATNSLTKDEQSRIRKELGNFKTPLCFGVAKLFLAPIEGPREWHYPNVWGAVVLTIDRSVQSDPKPRLIQIFDLETYQVKFQVCLLLLSLLLL